MSARAAMKRNGTERNGATTVPHAMTAQSSVVPIGQRCVLCGVELKTEIAIRIGLCDSCEKRPEARAKTVTPAPRPQIPRGQARAFTVAEKSLITHLHPHVSAIDLLRVLNIRLVADLGPETPRYTHEQLHQEIRAQLGAEPTADGSWAGLRQLLEQARRSGLLDKITAQVIDDFSSVFRLAPAQRMHLLDVVKAAKDGGR
jgi:hypothetical protein